MIINNPVIRLVLKAISAFGLVGTQRDSGAARSNRDGQRDSPFVLVGRARDGRWGVFQGDFNHPLASFDKLHDACSYANELARTRTDSMVLIQKDRNSSAHPASSMARGAM